MVISTHGQIVSNLHFFKGLTSFLPQFLGLLAIQGQRCKHCLGTYQITTPILSPSPPISQNQESFGLKIFGCCTKTLLKLFNKGGISQLLTLTRLKS
jgi:hypothetical protein